MRHDDEYRMNNVAKRGIVIERDPKKKRVKVRFEDEDEQPSMWVDVLASSAKTTKTFMMPDEDDEVWCLFDAKGEDGCVVGSKYNEKDAPPHESNDDISIVGSFGSIHLDKASGNLTIQLNGNIKVTASRIDFEKG